MTCGMAARSKSADDEALKDGAHFSFSPIDLVAKRHVSTLSEGRNGTDRVVFKSVSSKEVKQYVIGSALGSPLPGTFHVWPIIQLGTMSIMWPWWPW